MNRDRHVVENARPERGVVVARHGQADVHLAGHLEWIEAGVPPVHPVRRMEDADVFIPARNLHPVRRRRHCHRRVKARSAGREAPLVRDALAGAHEHRHVPRAWRQRFANHHARFRPGIGPLDCGDSNDEIAIVGERLIEIMERVRGAPDVRTRAGYCERPGRVRGTATPADCPDILALPWTRWRGWRCSVHEPGHVGARNLPVGAARDDAEDDVAFGARLLPGTLSRRSRQPAASRNGMESSPVGRYEQIEAADRCVSVVRPCRPCHLVERGGTDGLLLVSHGEIHAG